MSVKIMGLVWDMECHQKINGVEFKPGHKFVLLAYADHADHDGKSIFPAVQTIAKKTGYQERNTQILTHDLEAMGLLVNDGVGPRGTNRWRIPVDNEGVKIAPLQILQGAINSSSLGANSLGANSLGAKIAHELKEPEPNIEIDNANFLILERAGESIFDRYSHRWKTIRQTLANCHITRTSGKIIVKGIGTDATMYQDRYARSFERVLVGILNEEITITFKE